MALRDVLGRLDADATAAVVVGELEFRIRRASPGEVAVLRHTATVVLPREELIRQAEEGAGLLTTAAVDAPADEEEATRKRIAAQVDQEKTEAEWTDEEAKRRLKESDVAFVCAVVTHGREALPDNYGCPGCSRTGRSPRDPAFDDIPKPRGKRQPKAPPVAVPHAAWCGSLIVDAHPERWEAVRLSATEPTNGNAIPAVVAVRALPYGSIDILAAEAALLTVGGARGLDALRRFRVARGPAPHTRRNGKEVRDPPVRPSAGG